MTKRAQIYEFYKKVESRKCLSFKKQFLNWQQMQNFRTIFPKLHQLGQKKKSLGHEV